MRGCKTLPTSAEGISTTAARATAWKAGGCDGGFELETVSDLRTLVEHRNRDLSRERDACAPQFDAQALFIDGFQASPGRCYGAPRLPVR
jgi:hypothetical protein